MRQRTLWFVISALLLMAFVMLTTAQDAGTYEGAFTFDYPADWTLTEGNDLVQVSNEGEIISVYGPSAFANVLGGMELEGTEALAFFLDRNGYTVGEDAMMDGMSGVNVELPRRDQSGVGTLVDIGYGRQAVVVYLSEEAMMDSPALAQVVGSASHIPVTVADFETDLREVLQITDTFEDAFTVDYPVGVTAQAGNNLVKLLRGGADVTVFGDDSYNQVLGAVEFEDESSALSFFLDRNGYTVGEAVETEDAVAAFGVELPRREQSGTAYLVDLDYGHRAVVVALSGGEAIDQALSNIISETALGSVSQLPSIADYITGVDDASTLLAAVEAAGLTGALDGGEITVFAPSNAAFEAALTLLGMSAEDLLADTETLTTILQYHVVEGSVLPEESMTVTTLEGSELEIVVGDDGSVMVGDSMVTGTVTDLSNGVIHMIDAVLVPPAISEAMEVANLATMIPADTTYEGVVSFDYPGAVALTEGNDLIKVGANGAEITVFAPGAYATVLGGVDVEGADALSFFLDRNGFTVGDAVESDLENVLAAFNVTLPRRNQSGVAYLFDLSYGTGVITSLSEDGVLSTGTGAYLEEIVRSTISYPPGVADIAAETADFSILAQAVEAAGLADTLNAGGVTVFAPTNEAIVGLLNDLGLSAEDLLGNTEILTEILQYHVTSGSVMAEDVVALDGMTVDMLNGQTVMVTVTDEGVVLNDSINVTATDITARDGGVIHVIDAVLVPACYVSTDGSIETKVLTRPNGAVITALPVDTDVAAYEATILDGVTYYRVDEYAATDIGDMVIETWVSADELTSTGVMCGLFTNMAMMEDM